MKQGLFRRKAEELTTAMVTFEHIRKQGGSQKIKVMPLLEKLQAYKYITTMRVHTLRGNAFIGGIMYGGVIEDKIEKLKGGKMPAAEQEGISKHIDLFVEKEETQWTSICNAISGTTLAVIGMVAVAVSTVMASSLTVGWTTAVVGGALFAWEGLQRVHKSIRQLEEFMHTLEKYTHDSKAEKESV